MTEPHANADRRPIATRERKASIALASAVARAGLSANTISVLGMVAGLGSGAALALTPGLGPAAARGAFLAAAVLIQLRLLANMLDGMVAVSTGQASPVGELYNEIPDRVSDAATLIGLGYAAGGSPELGYVATCLAFLTAYIRAVGRGAGAGSDFRGPMAKPQRMFLCTVTALYIALAPAAWQPSFGRGWSLPAAALAVVALGSFVTCVRRLLGIAGKLSRA